MLPSIPRPLCGGVVDFPELVAHIQEKNNAFFGRQFVIPPIPTDITKEKIEKWERHGFKLHWFPKLDLAKDVGGQKQWESFPGWTKQPGRSPTEITSKLPGGWVLFDTRTKPQYDSGAQIYPNDDLIGKVLEKLRQRVPPLIEAVPNVADPKSRFGIYGSVVDQPDLMRALAQALDFPVDHLDLPYQVETSVLMHMYNPGWGDTTTFEWFKDTSGQCRLYGGYSVFGGLSYVDWSDLDYRFYNIGFRPLGRLS